MILGLNWVFIMAIVIVIGIKKIFFMVGVLVFFKWFWGLLDWIIWLVFRFISIGIIVILMRVVIKVVKLRVISNFLLFNYGIFV